MVVNPLLINLSVLIQKPTGVTTYIHHVVPALKFLQPTLLVAEPWPEFTCYPIPSQLTPEHGLKGHLRRFIWTQFRLPQIYRHHQANLLFSPVPEAPLWGSCRTVVMAHDLIPLRFARPFWGLAYYARYVLPRVLAQSLHIVCNSQTTAQELQQQFHLPDQKITPIPLGYDTNRFRPLNLPRHPYFLYLGRPDPHKNLARLIQAFAHLPPALKETELWIAGSPDRRYTPPLMAQSQQLGLGQRVKFLDYVSSVDLPRLYAQAIALVFPSLWEGFGLPVLEAMACGTPVITSNLSALPEVAGEAALLVDPYNVGEITEAMAAIATETALWQSLQAAGWHRVKQFSWVKTGQQTAEILRQLL